MTKKKKTKKIDENELVKIIDIISQKLAYKFKFGYHDFNDMKQQISIFALEGLKNYDYKRPLENFLWTHVRNRLFNYKRDNYQRPDKPCLSCPLYKPHCSNTSNDCSKYTNKNDCDLYSSWLKRNSSKKNLMHLNTIEEVKDYGGAFISNHIPLLENISNNEILQLIEDNLNGDDRMTYLKIKDGCKVSKKDTNQLINTIKEILKNHG